MCPEYTNWARVGKSISAHQNTNAGWERWHECFYNSNLRIKMTFQMWQQFVGSVWVPSAVAARRHRLQCLIYMRALHFEFLPSSSFYLSLMSLSCSFVELTSQNINTHGKRTKRRKDCINIHSAPVCTHNTCRNNLNKTAVTKLRCVWPETMTTGPLDRWRQQTVSVLWKESVGERSHSPHSDDHLFAWSLRQPTSCCHWQQDVRTNVNVSCVFSHMWKSCFKSHAQLKAW